MEKLSRLWSDSTSIIYHNKNVRYIDEFCKQNGINVTVKDIKRFLEKSESGNLKYEKVNNKRISEENKGFTTRGRFFSQLHADTIHLSRKMSYSTNLKYLLLVTSQLTRYVLVEGLFDLKFKSMEKAFISIFERIKKIYPNFSSFVVLADGGGEMSSGRLSRLVSSYKGRMNIIATRPYRGTKGSGVAERQVRNFRMALQLQVAENKRIPFKKMLSNAEKSLNRKKSSALGQSPEDALTARPQDLVMLSRSKMIKRRPYLQKALMDKQQLPIGTIVRIHMMVQKRFAAEVKESYSDQRLSPFFVITNYDRSREIVYYILSDIFLFERLPGTFSNAELDVSHIDLFEAIAKEERRIKQIISYNGDMVIYKSYYKDYQFIANRKILE